MRPRSLLRNVAANAVNALASVATTLVATPLILHDLGLAGLGAWTLAQTLVLYLVTADAGIGPAVVRFVALHVGGGRRDEVRRLLFSALATYAALGALAIVLAQLLAGPLTSLFDVPAALRDDAEAMFRIVGVVVLGALCSVAMANVLQGLERFGAVAVGAGAASATYLAGVVVALSVGAGLPGLALAALAQQVVGVVVRAVALRDVLLAGRPRLLRRGEAAEVGRFAARLQLNVLGALVGSQSDKVVVGLISTARAVGEVGIAAQVADGGRIVAGAALGPMTSRMAAAVGRGDTAGLAALYARLTRVWMAAIVGGAVVGGLALPGLLEAWLGESPGRTTTYAALLVAGAGFHLATGVVSSYVRAIGRPGVEVGYGAITVGGNVAGSVALGLAFGPVGVVAATPLSYLVGLAWLLRAVEPDAPGTGRLVAATLARTLPLALVAGVPCALATGALAGALPAGVALVPCALVVGLCLLGYLAALTRGVPSPARVRAAFA